MTRPLKTASSRPGRRCLSRSVPGTPSSPVGWTSLTAWPRDDRASGTSVQHHPEQVGARFQQVVRRLACDALGSPGGVNYEQDPVKAAEEVRGPQHPLCYGRIEQHEVPTLLQASYCFLYPRILEQGGRVRENGTGRYDQKARDVLVSVVLQVLTIVEAARKSDEVRFTDHAVQLRVFEVAIYDGGPPSHTRQGDAEAEADARAPRARIGAGDDDASGPPHPQKVVRQPLVVTPHR